MTTLTKTYPTELAARRAVEALRVTGVPEGDIRLLAGTAPRDIRREPVGGFAGPLTPHASIGTYGGRVLQRRQGTGSFAGDPDQQRQGSFGDTDRVLIVTYARFWKVRRGAYDVTVKQIDCVCGVVVKGENDDELWKRAQEHLRSDHPDLVGKVTREDILAQAEEI